MTSTCNILNSFGNKGIYCQAMSGNEYNTAEETGPERGGGGLGSTDGCFWLHALFDPLLLFPLICGLFGTNDFFKVTRVYFFIENIRDHMIKKRYPGADIKLYSSSSYLKKSDLERCSQLIFKKSKIQFDNVKKVFSEYIKQFCGCKSCFNRAKSSLLEAVSGVRNQFLDS